MANFNITHPQLWGILHIPSNKLLRQYPKGYGHTQLDVEDPINHVRLKRGINLPPRLFTDENMAKRALTSWLAGEWRANLEWESTDEYGSGFNYRDAPAPVKKTSRIKEDMKVVPIYLYSEEPNDE